MHSGPWRVTIVVITVTYIGNRRSSDDRLVEMTLDQLSLLRYCALASTSGEEGRPYVVEVDGMRALHFEALTVQSQMRLDDPATLEIDYTRAMMGFLLFNPEPRDIVMIGLGGGSLAKYCLRTLPDVRFTAVEIDPDVIALRDAFGIPPDGERFRVVCADGADYVRRREHAPDVLLIDGFDRGGQPDCLCTSGFYDDCHTMLAGGGVMAVNLWSGDRRYGLYASRIRDSFEDRFVAIGAEHDSNRIAFACKGRGFPPRRRQLLERARMLATHHPIGIMSTAQRIQQRLERRAHYRPDLWDEGLHRWRGD
ncbi:MAG: spermidine synthase [Azoarcus sp.]|uniref:Spermidine synthase n=2 Tax=Aromatoleum tolulyticum TaxID=34027 RepID=A0A1N6WT08_9RHOO|nr:spermidine synthase [Azoarcus sp.]SIQ93244.1 spermidine synthase [Aromatoleum tolulyticum]